ncbi:flagellin N-terminal helical domain-containing protein [Candidatus Liberibacter brunswickensis]|uniref:flagellin N-terminal helical domain-containing protein n=1 Tax=Candidatus Liberibacter brunswickensis TaxID=1968796 RepID=UPI002FDFC999
MTILTNLPAMSASQKLRDVNYNLEVTQDRVSSGMRVADASHNAAYWSIAQIMKSDNAALSAVSDAIGLGSSKVDIAKAGINEAIKVISSIKEKLVAAIERGTDSSSLQSDIEQLQEQLKDIAKGASFNGENWLRSSLESESSSISKSVISSFIRHDDGTVNVTTIDYSLDKNTILFDSSNNEEHHGLLDSNNKIKINKPQLEDVSLKIHNLNGKLVNKKVKIVNTDAYWLKAAGAVFNQEAGIAVLADNPNTGTSSGNGTGGTATPDSSTQKVYLRLENTNKWVLATTDDNIDIDGVKYKGIVARKLNNKQYYVDTQSTVIDSRSVPEEISTNYSIVTLDITKSANDDVHNETNAIQEMLSFVDSKLQSVTSAAGKIGSISSRIHLQEDFIKFMGDSIQKGIGRLVDADMSVESSRLAALQTQQQLAIQALSIINGSTSRILSLFR